MASEGVADILNRLSGGVEDIAPYIRDANSVLQQQGINTFIRRHGAPLPAHENILDADRFQREDRRAKIPTAIGLWIARVHKGESFIAQAVDAAPVRPVVRELPKRLRLGGESGIRRGRLEEDHVG